MLLFFALLSCLFAISFASNPTLGGGWSWDTANALGLAAFAGMLYLVMTPRGARDLKKHEWFSYVTIGLVAFHAFWMLLSDGAVIEYVKPSAPWYMWTGIAGLLLLYATLQTSIMPTRLKLYKSYRAFSGWHRGIAILAVLLTAHHIIISGFYFEKIYQIGALLLLLAWVCFSRELRVSPNQQTAASPVHLI
ncbi:MAG: hypothetical protein AAF512_19510, partial [Pseudomonadota bacterium]